MKTLLALLLLSASAFATENWQDKIVPDDVEIRFPTTPEPEDKREAVEKKHREWNAEPLSKQEPSAQEIYKYTLLFCGVITGIGVYFIPSIVGARKENATAIAVLNVFLGWTFIGWVVALVWAAMKDRRS